MSGSNATPPPVRRFPAGILLVLAAAALGIFSSLGEVGGPLLAGGAVVAAIALRSLKNPAARTMSLALPLVVLLEITLGAAISIVTELLAGAVGILYLAWLAEDAPQSVETTRGIVDSLMLPTLAVVTAIAVGVIVPVSGLLVGATAGILGGLLLYVGWLFGNPQGFRDAPSGS